MLQLTLYGTLGCHLCDDAKDILAPFLQAYPDRLVLQDFDIAQDDELIATWGEKIPVLAYEQQFLYWPFDEDQVLAWLNQLEV